MLLNKRFCGHLTEKELPSGSNAMGHVDIVQLEKEENWHQVLAKGWADLLQTPSYNCLYITYKHIF